MIKGAIYILVKYAQEICKTTSVIIGYDVLITDEKGLIIGCSSPDRVGATLNEVPLVVKSKKGYMVTKEEAMRVSNTQVGVTYPIENSNGDVIGTIAITGDPDRVNPFALIVKKQAEMFLREKVFLETKVYRERVMQSFVKDVVTLDPRFSSEKNLRIRAKELGYDDKLLYVVLDGKIHPLKAGASENDFARFENRTLLLIRKFFNQKSDIVVSNEESSFTVLHAVKRTGDQVEKIRTTCLSLCEEMKNRGIDLKVGVGGLVDRLNLLAESYSEALEVLIRGSILCPDLNVYMIEDFRLEELVDYSKNYVKANFIEKKLAPLYGCKGRDEMEETLLQWCSCNFSIKDAADILHIHRNTLHYRLEKMEGLFGFSLRDFRKMIDIYVAIKLKRLRADIR